MSHGGTERGGESSQSDMMMGCGDTASPSSRAFIAENMAMHDGMAINFTGDTNVDFIRGMIPHHVGALKMCVVLWHHANPIDSELDGFCLNVVKAQKSEISMMNDWLARKGAAHTASANGCNISESQSHMMMGCGNTASPSSRAFIAENMAMHDGMAINFAGDANVDFAKGMIPHHAGAVKMCDVAHQFASPLDSEIVTLCKHIQLEQEIEICWMSDWLKRKVAASKLLSPARTSASGCKNGYTMMNVTCAPKPKDPLLWWHWAFIGAGILLFLCATCALHMKQKPDASPPSPAMPIACTTADAHPATLDTANVSSAAHEAETAAEQVTVQVDAAKQEPTLTPTAMSQPHSIATYDYLLRSFLAHLANYVGMGLISGGMVHVVIFQKNAITYGTQILFGVCIHLLHHMIEAGFQFDTDMLRFLCVSIFVALGTGTVNGGTQHYLDNPKPGAVLVGSAFVITYIAYCARTVVEQSTSRKVTTKKTGMSSATANELEMLRACFEKHNPEATRSTDTRRVLTWRSVCGALVFGAGLFALLWALALMLDEGGLIFHERLGSAGGHH